ncbi:type II secretion system protein [Luteolibacter sp. AS25]|uniref:type II secretion system protein n=1 Tax=Luteolibacter sp. AS25 TaxID=3135776 RepID=UPI00398A98B4
MNCGKQKNGFTLLELVLALGILAILTASIFSVVGSVLGLTSALVSEQKREARLDDFENYIEFALRQSAGDSQFQLSQDTLNTNIQSFFITNSHIPYPSQNKETIAFTSEFRTEIAPGGLLQVLQYHYPEESDPSASEFTVPDGILLLKELTYCQWQFYDPTINDWVSEWGTEKGRPRQIRFLYQTEGMEFVFTKSIWLPSPVTVQINQ